jgi:hypothetical protein
MEPMAVARAARPSASIAHAAKGVGPPLTPDRHLDLPRSNTGRMHCLPGSVEATDCPGHGRRSPRSRASRRPRTTSRASTMGRSISPKRRSPRRRSKAADSAARGRAAGHYQRRGCQPRTTARRSAFTGAVPGLAVPSGRGPRAQSGGSATAAAAAFEKCCRRRGHGLSAVYDPSLTRIVHCSKGAVKLQPARANV